MKSKTLLETIKCDGGFPHHLSYHQKRLDLSLRTLGSSHSHSLRDLITPPDKQLYRCRFVYDAEHYSMEYFPYRPRIIKSLKIVYDDTIDYSFKYAERNELDRLFSQREKADDVLIVKNGLMTDTSIANVAFYIDGQWKTPLSPLLEGTTRARLIADGTIVCADINVDQALRASRLALFNAMIGFFEMDNVILR